MTAYLSLRLASAGWGMYGEWYALTADGEHWLGKDYEMNEAEAIAAADVLGLQIIGEVP